MIVVVAVVVMLLVAEYAAVKVVVGNSGNSGGCSFDGDGGVSAWLMTLWQQMSALVIVAAIPVVMIGYTAEDSNSGCGISGGGSAWILGVGDNSYEDHYYRQEEKRKEKKEWK